MLCPYLQSLGQQVHTDRCGDHLLTLPRSLFYRRVACVFGGCGRSAGPPSQGCAAKTLSGVLPRGSRKFQAANTKNVVASGLTVPVRCRSVHGDCPSRYCKRGQLRGPEFANGVSLLSGEERKTETNGDRSYPSSRFHVSFISSSNIVKQCLFASSDLEEKQHILLYTRMGSRNNGMCPFYRVILVCVIVKVKCVGWVMGMLFGGKCIVLCRHRKPLLSTSCSAFLLGTLEYADVFYKSCVHCIEFVTA